VDARGNGGFDSVTNVGNRPTFGAELFAIETHLLNFHPIELTPETEVEICFLDRLRDEVKFPSVDALREQIARDVKKSAAVFSFGRLLLAEARLAVHFSCAQDSSLRRKNSSAQNDALQAVRFRPSWWRRHESLSS
jgi:hypothetical protein